MVIAVLDGGFSHVDFLPAFDSLRLSNQILGTKDFVNPGNDVYNEHEQEEWKYYHVWGQPSRTADGFLVMAVAAIDSNGKRAGFSSIVDRAEFNDISFQDMSTLLGGNYILRIVGEDF